MEEKNIQFNLNELITGNKCLIRENAKLQTELDHQCIHKWSEKERFLQKKWGELPTTSIILECEKCGEITDRTFRGEKI